MNSTPPEGSVDLCLTFYNELPPQGSRHNNALAWRRLRTHLTHVVSSFAPDVLVTFTGPSTPQVRAVFQFRMQANQVGIMMRLVDNVCDRAEISQYTVATCDTVTHHVMPES